MDRRKFLKCFAMAGAAALLNPVELIKAIAEAEVTTKPTILKINSNDFLLLSADDFHSRYIHAASQALANAIDKEIMNNYLGANYA